MHKRIDNVLLVRIVDGDAVGVDDLGVDEHVALVPVEVGPLQLGDVGAPHAEEHEALVRVERDAARLAQPNREDGLADETHRSILQAAEEDDFPEVVQEVPVVGDPVDSHLVDRGQGKHVRLRQPPPVNQVVDVGTK